MAIQGREPHLGDFVEKSVGLQMDVYGPVSVKRGVITKTTDSEFNSLIPV